MDELIKELYEAWGVKDYHLSQPDYAKYVKDAHRILVENAKAGKVVYYGELPVFNVLKERFGDDAARLIGLILGACSEYEASRGRPLISSIVVSQDTSEPGRGFYGLAAVPVSLSTATWEGQGKKPPQIVIGKREDFWLDELQDTLDYWAIHEV
ncbi:MAG: hypothetical protein Q8O05_02095 [Chloroflexota bacterium]|nr:hypothetical protein [Chloroflexota bacterium]